MGRVLAAEKTQADSEDQAVDTEELRRNSMGCRAKYCRIIRDTSHRENHAQKMMAVYCSACERPLVKQATLISLLRVGMDDLVTNRSVTLAGCIVAILGHAQ